MDTSDRDSLRQAALDYHANGKPGKLEIRATKPLANGRDLARAYSPGVAEACVEIKENPTDAARYAARGNLVAVVSNGSAVLGLGNIGPLAVFECAAIVIQAQGQCRVSSHRREAFFRCEPEQSTGQYHSGSERTDWRSTRIEICRQRYWHFFGAK